MSTPNFKVLEVLRYTEEGQTLWNFRDFTQKMSNTKGLRRESLWFCPFVQKGQKWLKPSHTKGFGVFCPRFCPFSKLCEIDEILQRKPVISMVWGCFYCEFVQFPLILSTDEILHRNPVIPRVWGVFEAHFVQNFKKSCQKNFLKKFQTKVSKIWTNGQNSRKNPHKARC